MCVGGLLKFRYEAGENKLSHPVVPSGWQKDYILAISPPGRSMTRAQGGQRAANNTFC